MQLSTPKQQAFNTNFTTNLRADTQARIAGISVVMRVGGFTCSGALLYVDASQTLTYILTAKHNLLLGQALRPASKPKPSEKIDAFTSGVTVSYGGGALGEKPKQTASVDSSAKNGGNANLFPTSSADDWQIDLMLLQSSDSNLHTFAQTNAVFPSLELAQKTYEAVLSKPTFALKRTDENAFIQTGFGYSNDKRATNDGSVGKFQVRYTLPQNAGVADSVYDYDTSTGVDDTYKNVFLMDADNSNSTAPGDSGGPVFVVDYARDTKKSQTVMLIGITLGANQALTKTDLGNNIVNNTASYIGDFVAQVAYA